MEVLSDSAHPLELRRELGEPMLKLLHADYYVSYEWDADSQRFSNGIALNLDINHTAKYETQHQLVDPITPELQRRRAPTLVTQVMPQSTLVRSAFFNEFIGRAGLYWGLNIHAFPVAEHSTDLRIWRARHRGNFEDADLDLLRLIYPALVGALRRTRHMASSGSGSAAACNPRITLENRLIDEMHLSHREAQVAARAARGACDKAIARELQIEFTTVRTHLTKAFRKLGVDNRSKLASQLARWSLQ